ncbi:MAG: hypothetical protein A4E71_02878 [Smithella sp. PtaU1.Bin162]|nr:MAG: hypothetical protein A4E71_02878 [Smithella sp. PtaU1.Bin162]
MGKTAAKNESAPNASEKSAKVIIYPAVADSVDLPDFLFHKNRKDDAFTLLTPDKKQFLPQKSEAIAAGIEAINDRRLKTLLSPLWPDIADSDISFTISGRRAALLTISPKQGAVIIEAHWNLFVPYFYQIKALPLAHPEILDIFADAVFHYAALAMQYSTRGKNELRNLAINKYGNQPELLLASLDIFDKLKIYHIHPTRVWFNRILAANDKQHPYIDVTSTVPADQAGSEFLKKVTDFIHKIVKNYAFRYVDYLWTQRYKIIFGDHYTTGMVVLEGNDIVININPLMHQAEWKPAVYLSLGYAVMLAILRASGKNSQKENTYLAAMKTWNRYLSFDESSEKQSVCELFSLKRPTAEEQCCQLLACISDQKNPDLMNDLIMLMNYSSKETFEERLNVLDESRYEKRTGVYFEKLWGAVQSMNASLMKSNINYSKLIEVLRNDNIDHLQLANFLHTGRLGKTAVVDISEWLLLRTLLYDLINAPKVFRNDYKMLLKVLTKVIKSLIVYVWTLGLYNDERYETVSTYITKLVTDIFVFNRVKIYEIVADPVECLEAEAVTGYLLNWAILTQKQRRSIIQEILSSLSRNVVENLSVKTTDDVDQMIRVMTIRTSGLFGFYLYQSYRWGNTQDKLTERIRSHFPELLKHAQQALIPTETIRGGAMLLLLLAQIISDERDGFARNIVITEEEKQIVFNLIRQCVDWDQKHFVMMVAGIAAGYMGSIDGWTLQQFDTLLGRYDGGDRVVLRSVVQYDVDNLIERTLITAGNEEESTLFNKINLLRFGVDPVVSDQANKFLGAMAAGFFISQAEAILKRKDIRELLLALSRHLKAQLSCT